MKIYKIIFLIWKMIEISKKVSVVLSLFLLAFAVSEIKIKIVI